jgi:hypothetical protein
VQRVAWHALVFDWLDKRKPQDVGHWRRNVAPAAPAAASSSGSGARDR